MGQKQLTEDNLKKVDGLRPIAEELGCSLAQLALAWAASNPDVSTVITGATKPQQARVTRHGRIAAATPWPCCTLPSSRRCAGQQPAKTDSRCCALCRWRTT
jgi:Aldo/keto reductase family